MEQIFELDKVLQQVNQYTQSDLGSQLVTDLKPNSSKLVVKRELARLKEAMEYVRLGYDIDLNSSLNIHFELSQISKGFVLTSQQIFKILTVARSIIKLKKQFANFEGVEAPFLAELVDTIAIDPHLLSELTRIIDDNGEVKEDASEELKQLISQESIIKQRFDKVIRQFLNSNSESLQEKFTITRDGRVCVLVLAGDKNKFNGYQHGQSASGLAVYVEPSSFIGYNNELINISSAIEAQIHALLVHCCQIISSYASNLSANMETCALLDMVFAKAKWGYARQGCVAELMDPNYGYDLKSIRHPLIDDKTVVSNNISCTGQHRVILITGANTAGKTVLLKTIGLSFYMVACGLPLLADSAKLCLMDQVLDDIGDQQSIVESLSTFSSHVAAWKIALQKATSNSLVLLDELGTGTDPKEGQALGQALLEQLVDKHCFVVATTHFQTIKEYGLMQPSIICGSMEFDIHTYQPTYKFIQNTLGTSYAFEIALQCGLNKQLIERASELKKQQESQSEQLMKTLAQKEIDLNQQLAAYTKEKESFEKQREEFLTSYTEKYNKLEQQFEQKQAQYQQQVNEKLESLEQLLAQVKPNMNVQSYQTIVKKSKVFTSPVEVEDDQPLQVGDYAKIVNSNSIVKITKINGTKVEATLNGKTINTKLNNLVKTHHVAPAKVKHVQKRKEFVPMAFDTRLNILGYTVDQGIDAVAAFIDKALVANQKRVVVITGDGSGRLRQGIHAYLKQNRFVDRFELAARSEGATGATVVYLK